MRGALLKQWILSVIALALVVNFAWAGKVLNDALVQRPFSHHVWQEVLRQHVSHDGTVNFIRLRAEPRRLNQYLKQLAAVSPDSHPAWFPDRRDEIAYWLNAHNALALRLILDHYPIKSLDELPDFAVWKDYVLGGKYMSLEELEQRLAGMVRPPDVMLGVSRLTLDSPPLYPEAYQGEKLPAQLARQRSRIFEGDRFVRYVPGECMGLELGSFLYAMNGQAGMTGGLSEAEMLEQPVEVGGQPDAGNSVGNPWVRWVLPSAPPHLHADLRKDCNHPVVFLPSDSRLRDAASYR